MVEICNSGHIPIHWDPYGPCPLCAAHARIEQVEHAAEIARDCIDEELQCVTDPDEDQHPLCHARRVLRCALDSIGGGK